MRKLISNVRAEYFQPLLAAILATAITLTLSCSMEDIRRIDKLDPGGGEDLSSSSEASTADLAKFVGVWRGGNASEGYIFVFNSNGTHIVEPEINSPDEILLQSVIDGSFGWAFLSYTADGSKISFEYEIPGPEDVQCVRAPCFSSYKTADYQFSSDGNTLTLTGYTNKPITLRKVGDLPSSSSSIQSSSSGTLQYVEQGHCCRPPSCYENPNGACPDVCAPPIRVDCTENSLYYCAGGLGPLSPDCKSISKFVGVWRGNGHIYIFYLDGKYIQSPEPTSYLPMDILQMVADGFFGKAESKYIVRGTSITLEHFFDVRCDVPPCPQDMMSTRYQFSLDGNTLTFENLGSNDNEATLHKIGDLPSSSSNTQSSSSAEKLCKDVRYDTRTHFCDSRDGKVYKFVDIGNQTWMAQNLNYKTPYGNSFEVNDNEPYRLYGFHGVVMILCPQMVGIRCLVCPVGWHLPSDDEWQTLIDFAGNDAGTKLISGTSEYVGGWWSGTIAPLECTQPTETMETCAKLSERAYFWQVNPHSSEMLRSISNFADFNAVRCVKDNNPPIMPPTLQPITTETRK
jgi:uncharacterized protein (TIGR02145 family)